MKTICIAGKNDIAVDILSFCRENFRDYRLVCVLNKSDIGENSWQKSLKWFAGKWNIEILSIEQVYAIKDLVFISTEFDMIVKTSDFLTTQLFNIHFSMLPKYKGCGTSVWPILNGDTYSGVTLHVIRDGIDTGEIIEQRQISIDEDDNSLKLYKKMIAAGTSLVIDNLKDLISGKYNCYPQSGNGSTYYGSRDIDYSGIALDVKRTAFQIKQQVKGYAFRPYQLLQWRDERYFDAFITEDVSTQKPGYIIEDNKVYTKIATIDYNVVLYKDVLDELLFSICVRDNDTAKLLCKSKSIVNEQNKKGWTPLTVAVYNNNFEMVNYLVKNGSDINVLNNNGTNLLMYAKDCYMNTGDATIFDFLIKYGLDPYKKDYREKSLYDYCMEAGIDRIGELCFEKVEA
ncbi:MAG: ankyrin repeat domain-containing protein [Acetatifactor sp.]|nr:ankyrin repeat domain-containing protein [Acetatifactor sp.]